MPAVGGAHRLAPDRALGDGLEGGLHQQGGGGLAQRAGNADEPERAGGMAVERGREPGDRGARVRHHQRGQTVEGRLGAERHGAPAAGLLHELASVGGGAALGHEQIAGTHLAGIHRQAGDLEVAADQLGAHRFGQPGEAHHRGGRRAPGNRRSSAEYG